MYRPPPSQSPVPATSPHQTPRQAALVQAPLDERLQMFQRHALGGANTRAFREAGLRAFLASH